MSKACSCVAAQYGTSQYPQFDPCSPESPVAQWLEDPTRSWRVMGSNPTWDLDFSQSTFLLEFT